MCGKYRWVLALALLALVSCGGALPLQRTHERGMLPAHWTAADGKSEPVPFSFEAESSSHGRMVTTLGRGGEHFQGAYMRVEPATKGHIIFTKIYEGWAGPEWAVWQHDADGGWTETASSSAGFAHHYTGKVVASLSGSEHHAMRCHFTLKDPFAGLLHGGEGKCQISDGGQIELEF